MVADYKTFDLLPLTLQRGLRLPKVQLAYKTYGRLASDTIERRPLPAFVRGHPRDDISGNRCLMREQESDGPPPETCHNTELCGWAPETCRPPRS